MQYLAGACCADWSGPCRQSRSLRELLGKSRLPWILPGEAFAGAGPARKIVRRIWLESFGATLGRRRAMTKNLQSIGAQPSKLVFCTKMNRSISREPVETGWFSAVLSQRLSCDWEFDGMSKIHLSSCIQRSDWIKFQSQFIDILIILSLKMYFERFNL